AMAYPHHIPTSRMSPPRFATNSDAIEVRPQFPMVIDHPEQHSGFEQHSLKRARMIGNNRSDALPCPPPRVMQPPPQSNRGTGHIFYKTRTCTRFTFGNCRNDDNFNFAHGEEGLRLPPPNWQDYVGPRNERKEERVQVGNWDDDKKIIHK
ncbi:zinc finger CCCH domain-containing protein 39-like, partial [Trifolium medium]|nr:zinc finger CCCH domain-containing protein 39-like [Trifolium medium]